LISLVHAPIITYFFSFCVSAHGSIINIVFLSGEKQNIDMDYKKAANDAKYWHGLLSVLIKQAEQEDVNAKYASSPNNNFVADEIVKLGELLKKGLITEDEFAAQKKKLLE